MMNTSQSKRRNLNLSKPFKKDQNCTSPQPIKQSDRKPLTLQNPNSNSPISSYHNDSLDTSKIDKHQMSDFKFMEGEDSSHRSPRITTNKGENSQNEDPLQAYHPLQFTQAPSTKIHDTSIVLEKPRESLKPPLEERPSNVLHQNSSKESTGGLLSVISQQSETIQKLQNNNDIQRQEMASIKKINESLYAENQQLLDKIAQLEQDKANAPSENSLLKEIQTKKKEATSELTILDLQAKNMELVNTIASLESQLDGVNKKYFELESYVKTLLEKKTEEAKSLNSIPDNQAPQTEANSLISLPNIPPLAINEVHTTISNNISSIGTFLTTEKTEKNDKSIILPMESPHLSPVGNQIISKFNPSYHLPVKNEVKTPPSKLNDSKSKPSAHPFPTQFQLQLSDIVNDTQIQLPIQQDTSFTTQNNSVLQPSQSLTPNTTITNFTKKPLLKFIRSVTPPPQTSYASRDPYSSTSGVKDNYTSNHSIKDRYASNMNILDNYTSSHASRDPIHDLPLQTMKNFEKQKALPPLSKLEVDPYRLNNVSATVVEIIKDYKRRNSKSPIPEESRRAPRDNDTDMPYRTIKETFTDHNRSAYFAERDVSPCSYIERREYDPFAKSPNVMRNDVNSQSSFDRYHSSKACSQLNDDSVFANTDEYLNSEERSETSMTKEMPINHHADMLSIANTRSDYTLGPRKKTSHDGARREEFRKAK